MTPATSLADRLVCIDCRATYPLEYRLECAVCRGLLELRYDLVDPAQTFCVIVTETGLKTEAALPSRAGTMFDEASLARLVEEWLAR